MEPRNPILGSGPSGALLRLAGLGAKDAPLPSAARGLSQTFRDTGSQGAQWQERRNHWSRFSERLTRIMTLEMGVISSMAGRRHGGDQAIGRGLSDISRKLRL